MIQEENEARRGRLNTALRELLYRRLQITRELDELDKNITAVEAAINENESTRRDIGTEVALKQSQKEEETNNDRISRSN